jgi:tetratricopeptide (TPR) repeat protein
MAKVIQFPVTSPEKFGFKPVRRKKADAPPRGQLDLFATPGGKLVNLNNLSLFERALLIDDAGDSTQAKGLYQQAIDEGDAVADAYCNWGILESEQQNFSKAIDCFTRCLSLEPRHFEAHYNLANQYAEVGNLPLARMHYEMAIEIEPSFPNAYFNLGLTLAMLKEVGAAVNMLHQYCVLAPAAESAQALDLIRSLTRTLS